MNTISYTSARGNLAKTMEKVCADHAPVIITRKSEQAVIMMSLEDYESLEETAYLLRSPNNARRLLDAVAEISTGSMLERDLED
ncbi:MAG: type II toxin-antitoxin system prevent-host-death family antitoxin [Candidatus Marinimicrobia bacterium]|nr:type II toxin-antitoxin system prevent-host-death family antitoxin [Candidatus Neomarinimicrobiota bacterium]